MLRQMLVPLDGSVLAEMALPNAMAMARATSSSLILLQVVPPTSHTRSAANDMSGSIVTQGVTQGRKEEIEHAQAYLWGIEGQLRAEGFQVTSRVRAGEPAKIIVSETTHDPGIAMIVMSTHGRSGLGRWFFGSVSEKVLHASPVPLLLVRPEESKEPVHFSDVDTYRKIMVPLDESALAEEALSQARVLALATEATLVLVLAMPPLSIPSMSLYMEATGYQIYADAWEADYQRLTRYVDEKADALRACGLQVETQLAQGNPAEVILKAVDDSDPDLIVMSTHSGGSSNSGALREIQELLLGSVALKMVQEAWLPVLLIPVRETSSAQVRVGEFAEASLDELQDVHSELAPVANVEPMTAVEPERRRPTAKDLSRP